MNRSRHIVLLACAMVLLLPFQVVAAAGSDGIVIPISPWRGGPVADPNGVAAYCAIEAAYRDGTVLAFAETKNRSVTLVILRRSGEKPGGTGSSVVSVFGGRAPFEVRIERKVVVQPDATLSAFAFPDGGAAVAALESGDSLRIGDYQGLSIYKLAATAVAMRQLSKCATAL